MPAFFCLPWRFFRFFVVVLFVLICVLNGVFFLLAFFFSLFFCKQALCVHFDNTGGERNNKEDIMDGERERVETISER